VTVAICFFGMPRYTNEGSLASISRCFDHLDVDIFAHFWGQELPEDFFKLSSKISNYQIEPLTDTRFHAYTSLIEMPEIKASEIYLKSGIDGFGGNLELPGWSVNPANIVSMWNSMSKSISLALAADEKNKYDRFVLIRTDLMPNTDFKLDQTFYGDIFKFLMPDYHPGSRIDCWTPDHIISMSKKAAQALTFLPQFSYHYYYAQKIPLIPEVMLGHHMKTQKLIIESRMLYYREAYRFWKDDGKI
jgi:hypothetical protein